MDTAFAFHQLEKNPVLDISDSLTSEDIAVLKTQILRYAEEPTEELCIDVSALNAVDSVTLGFFAWLHQLFDEKSLVVHFVGMNERLFHIFKVVGFIDYSKIFTFDETLSGIGDNFSELKTARKEVVTDTAAQTETVRNVSYKMFFPEPQVLTSMRQFLDDFLFAANIDEHVAGDIRVAAGEAFANAITHGAEGVQDPYVRVELRHYDHALVLEVFDNGAMFSGEFEPPAEVFRASGRGILLMRELADTIEFIPEPPGFDGRGTLVRITKRLD